jgi:hypothetical protein
MTTLQNPFLSVVIAWVNPLELLKPGLDALHNQHGAHPAEIIVVTRHSEFEQKQLCELYPEVILLSAPPHTTIPKLRSIGIKRSRGTIIAVTEDHCVPSKDWTLYIQRSFSDNECDVVGGPIENAYIYRRRDWAAFLVEYAWALRSDGSAQDAHPSLPGNNVAYRRQVIDGLCKTLDRDLWESFYHQELIESGARLKYEPGMLVYHRRPFDFGYFVKQRYHFSRSFAAMRLQNLTGFGRIKYGLGSMILPPLLILRGYRILSQKRRYVNLYLSSLPLIAPYVISGAFGEMLGYFLGGGDSLAEVE